MGKRIREIVPAMVALRKKVRAWRENKQQRYMPKELWEEAVQLARQYGVHPVSKNVEVSYTRLRKLTDGNGGKPKARFVELSPVAKVSGSQVEINRPDGCRMMVRGADAQTVESMTSAFLGMPR